MQNQNARDLLGQVRHFHKRAALLADCHGRAHARLRIHKLLEYLSRSERRLSDTLAQFGNAADPDHQRRWLALSPNPALSRVLRQMDRIPLPSEDDIIRIGLLLDDHLQLACQMAADQVEDPAIREVFLNLLDESRLEKSDLVRTDGGNY